MKKFHKIISNLPYVIVGYWVLFYIIGKLGFYHKYFELLDLIDFAPVCVSVFHFILNLHYDWINYSYDKVVLICTMIQISAMYLVRDSIQGDLYWWIYLPTLIGGIIIAFLTYLFTRRE